MKGKCESCGRDTRRHGGIPGRCIRCEELSLDAMMDIKAELEGVV